MKNKYGLIGFVSLIGFLGISTNEKIFFSFFAFAIFFEYFFKQKDEMFEENMRKVAANSFWVMLSGTVVLTLVYEFFLNEKNALEQGVLISFGLGIITFCLSLAFLEWKEGRRILND